MDNSLPQIHTLDIEYNGHGPFTIASSQSLGCHVNLNGGYLPYFQLFVTFKVDEHTEKTYRLKSIKPGDRLRFAYDGPNRDEGLSIEAIQEYSSDAEYELPEGMRLGLDVVLDDGEKIRLSYPEGGGMSIHIANAPLDHARVWVSAGNDYEEWSRQLNDLYAGDSLEIEIVATDWCDPYPKIVRKIKSEPQNVAAADED